MVKGTHVVGPGSTGGQIVVGYNGSPAAQRALVWAAAIVWSVRAYRLELALEAASADVEPEVATAGAARPVG